MTRQSRGYMPVRNGIPDNETFGDPTSGGLECEASDGDRRSNRVILWPPASDAISPLQIFYALDESHPASLIASS